MFGIEKRLFAQLKKLKEKYCLAGVKAEFEAEGSTFRDLIRLRRVTAALGIELHLKIGGVEAIRDIKESLEISVDGLIAPMVESPFAAHKFIRSVDKIYRDTKIHKSLNIETRSGVEQIDAILKMAGHGVDNITIGRTDLSGSYFKDTIFPDSEFVFDLLKSLGPKIQKAGLTLTVGGSISMKTIEGFQKYPELEKYVCRLETRKVMLPVKQMLHNDHAIKEALLFEEIYILSKKEFSDVYIQEELNRLSVLKSRTN